ncbi:GSCFA domain-containing protein [Lacisediminimonas profundi]|uniref:GSCFA domain-containing protein n=1 Tax=Lacisediminimonas profundi TaxID=2603856 RepID=UPI00124B13E0|nr:GSCFA domain-containing protein [Lacisediminimonas profundi]
MTNPYRGLNDFCFWSQAMTTPAPGHIDPAVRSDRIEPHHKVATMGSCFAQHISRHISAAGLDYLVTEKAPEGMEPDVARALGYGVFSARYGNVYTVRQAVQLFDRAFGRFEPAEGVWARGDRYVDAFRPQIEPEGFGTADEVREASVVHLKHVRDVFTQADWIVFTLGLTEAWRSKLDGAIYPTAPGVAGGSFSPDRHEFVNFTAGEVRDDLLALSSRIADVNPKAKILLTVSPVPLIATYEKRHVLVSTTYSKAALRVAADEAERMLGNVIYFPSYEIITSPAAGGRYYADDLREVTEQGVKHVMRIFSKHFLPAVLPAFDNESPLQPITPVESTFDVMCDEEVIQKALKEGGFR